MSFGNDLAITGNATRDPELRWTPAGAAVCNFGLAWNQKAKDGTVTAHFFDVTCWSELAENVAASVTKGMRVTVVGRLQQRAFTTKAGDQRSVVEIVADEVGPSLRWATAVVSRVDTRGGGGGGAETQPQFNADEEPF